ncbi:MAG: DNA-methyltransferase [Peptostreptococcaceae bacterium]
MLINQSINQSINLYNSNCLDKIKELINDGVVLDAIITDPPYNISRDNNFKTMGRAGIDFGEWDKEFDLTSWIKLSEPLLKKGGNIVIFNDWKNMTEITKSLEECGYEVKDLIRWKKTNAMPRNRDRRFITDYEVAVWAVKKGGKWTFNRLSDTYEIPEIVGGLTPKSEKLEGGHPTQKPIYVMNWIIERLTNENDLIADFFCGGGTTGVSAIKLNRRFIGVELDEKFYDMSKKRLKNTYKEINK